EVRAEAEHYRFHPALLDACVQIVGVALGEDAAADRVLMPIGIESYRLTASPAGMLYSTVTLVDAGPSSSTVGADVRVVDAAGRLVAELCGVTFRSADRAAL